MSIERTVYVTTLRPERREEYIDAHRQVNPKLMRRYQEAGMTHCSVHLVGDTLVLITEGEDLDRTAAILAADPLDQEWQAHVGPMKGDGDWQRAEPIFDRDL